MKPHMGTRTQLLRAAATGISKGNIEEASAKCAAVLAVDPNDHDAAHLMGFILLSKGDVQASLEMLRSAALGKGSDPELHLLIARAKNLRGDPDNAELSIRQAILAEPKTLDAYLGLVQSWGSRNSWADAERVARFGICISPGTTKAWTYLGRCILKVNGAGAALKVGRRIHTLNPGDAAQLLNLVEILFRQGDRAQAERLLERCCILAPERSDVWLRFAEFLKDFQRQDRSVPLLRRALMLEPARPASWDRLAHVLCFGDGIDQAPAASHRFAICDPSDSRAWTQYARFLDRPDDRDKRERAFTKALSVARRDPSGLKELAFIAHANKDNGRSHRFFEKYFTQILVNIENNSWDRKFYRIAVDALGYLVWDARYRLAEKFLHVLDATVVAGSYTHDALLKLSFAHGILSNYTPPLVSQLKPSLVVSLPVWGDDFLDVWLAYGLPSLIAEGNSGFWEGRGTCFQIFSSNAGIARIQHHPLIKYLSETVTFEYFNIEPFLNACEIAANYHAMAVAHWISLCLGRREAVDTMFLFADYILSNTALNFLRERLDEDHGDVFCSLDLPISDRGKRRFAEFFRTGGALEIQPGEMLDVFLDHPSQRVTQHTFDPDSNSFPSDPSRICIGHSTGFVICGLQPQVFLIRGKVLKEIWFQSPVAVDNGLADAALAVTGDASRMEMLVDPRYFACGALEQYEDRRTDSGYFPVRTTSEDPTQDLCMQIERSGFATPARMLAFQNPLFAVRGEVPMPLTYDAVESSIMKIPVREFAAAHQDFMEDVGKHVLQHLDVLE